MNFVSRMKVRLFDTVKKWRMEESYTRADLWDRSVSTADIYSAVALLEDRHYRNALDVGTALGHYAEAMAPYCDSVTAIDLSARAVARAAARLSKWPNIKVERANIRDFKSVGTFDLIILADVLYYLGDIHLPKEFKESLAHIKTLLAPGGRIFISNYISPGRREGALRAYIDSFKALGLRVEKETIFREGKKDWIQSVLS